MPHCALWNGTSSHCYFCTTKIGQGKMNQILVPLPKMLNSMRNKTSRAFVLKVKTIGVIIFHDGNWCNYVMYLRLCICTLWGHSLHHPSFVAVLHHSCMEITYTSTVVHSTTQNIRSTYVHNHRSKVAHVSCPVFVL